MFELLSNSVIELHKLVKNSYEENIMHSSAEINFKKLRNTNSSSILCLFVFTRREPRSCYEN